LSAEHQSIRVVHVVSAEDMYAAAMEHFKDVHIAICTAAVADYRPKKPSGEKIKKGPGDLTLELTRNPDILDSLGKQKKKQYLVGFALETQNELDNAIGKLHKKNLDAIVLNSMKDAGAGFGLGTNKISFIDKNSAIKTFELKTKAAVAADIWNEIISRSNA
jgi:phosphopantothenoylcysteine decarboxylase/phosphopantothenate--cysteine ligase